jgi:hypothetical protein
MGQGHDFVSIVLPTKNKLFVANFSQSIIDDVWTYLLVLGASWDIEHYFFLVKCIINNTWYPQKNLCFWI